MRRQLEDFLLSTWNHKGPASALLLPFSWLYKVFSQRHLRTQARRAWRPPVPVIVVGNILVGGTGKTPVTAAVCQTLQAKSWKPGLISRGYGIRLGAEPHLSDPRGDAAHLGDEPALLHSMTGAPVAVHPDRSRAVRQLLRAHPEIDVLIADDGLQHRALARDVEIIVQDARGTGNGRLLPAGPLREPAHRLTQADWIVTQLGADDAGKVITRATAGTHEVTMRLQPTACTHLVDHQVLSWPQWQARFSNLPCSAAAGIGNPERFFSMLRAAGLTLAHTRALPDHGSLDEALLNGLPSGPVLITAKDAVKCPNPADPRLWAVQVAAHFDDPTWLESLEALLRVKASLLRTSRATGIKL